MAEQIRSPFPGMDPYLEHPRLWPDVHNRLITTMANALAPQVRPRYYVAIEERIYLAGPEGEFGGRPDAAVISAEEESPPRLEESAMAYQPLLVELPPEPPDETRELYLEIRETAGHQVITVIELLSPANKRPGSEGRALYLRKRREILSSQTHLVEIDLLRGGQPMPLGETPPASDYRLVISRWPQRPQAHLYAFDLPHPIPDCPIPLQPETDSEPTLSLQELLTDLYGLAGYDLRLDYSAEPVPPLNPARAAWAAELLGR